MGSSSEPLAMMTQTRAVGRDDEILPEIQPAKRNHDPDGRVGASASGSWLKTLNGLIDRLDDPDPNVRAAAVTQLKEQGPIVEMPLRSRLARGSDRMCRGAEEVLRSFKRDSTGSSTPDEEGGATGRRPAGASMPGPPAELPVMAAVHDVRGLAQCVSLLVDEVARNGELPESTQGLFSRAMSSIKAMGLILDGLLDERAVHQRQELVPSLVNPVVENAVQVAAPLIDMYSVRLRTTWASEELAAVLDPQGILRAVCNLLWNACRYSPLGGAITVSTQRIDDCVSIVVGDEGPGIPANDRRRLTQPFARGENAGGKGWGLGLFIVNEVAQRHGGHVTIRPNGGRGSSIGMTLPLLRQRVEARPALIQ